ncbi:MAG: hypothetical protein R3B47_09585 [Bacteroidia bacterium]
MKTSDDQVSYYINTLIYLTESEDEQACPFSPRSRNKENYLAGF